MRLFLAAKELGPTGDEIQPRDLVNFLCESRIHRRLARPAVESAIRGRRSIWSPDGGSLRVVVPSGIDHTQVLRAVEFHAQVSKQGNCFAPNDLQHMLEDALGGDALVASGGVRRAREALSQAARRVVALLGTIGDALVLRCSSAPVPAGLRVLYTEIERAKLSGMDVQLLDVEIRQERPNSRSDRVALLRNVIARGIGATDLMDDAIAAMERCASDVPTALRAVLTGIESGALKLDGGVISANGAAAGVRRLITSQLWRESEQIESKAGEAAAPSPSPSGDDWVARGEHAAVLGDFGLATRMAIRATSERAGCGEPAVDRRLAELWEELGRPDAALHVLSEYQREGGDVDTHIVIGNLQASLRHVEDLGATIGTLRSLGLGSSDPELVRLEVLERLFRGRTRDAWGTVTSLYGGARGMCRQSNPRFLGAVAAVLFSLGREHSALRLLRIARRTADETGAIRDCAILRANFLLGSAHLRPAESVAADWRALSHWCAAWGLRDGEESARVRAAREFLRGRCPERALEVLAEARFESRYWSSAAVLTECVALDWEDHVSTVKSKDWRCGDEQIARKVELVRWLVGLECSAGGLDDARLPSSVTRDAWGCAIRAVLRTARSRTFRPHRARRVLNLALERMPAESTLIGAVARLVVRGASTYRRVQDLLLLSRRMADTTEPWLAFALALHTSAMAWGGAHGAEGARWLAERASLDDRTRVPGVRRWEWRFAVALAAVECRQREPSDWLVEQVIGCLEQHCREMPASELRAYLSTVPLHRMGHLAGVPVGDLRVGDVPSALTHVRAMLHRGAAREQRLRGRAAHFQRVLDSALVLKSSADVEEVLNGVVREVLEIFRAERAIALFKSGGSALAKVATVAGVYDIAPGEAEISHSVLELVRDTGRACVIDDACGDAKLGDRPSVRQFKPRSILVAPLVSRGEDYGYLYVEHRSLPRSFELADAEIAEGFAAQAALALANAKLVSDLRCSLDELARARTEAVRAESLRALGMMAGEVAHDFNNLLTTILGETQFLLEDARLRSSWASLEVIQRAARDGAAAIRRIQDSTRVKSENEFEVLDLGRIAREVLDYTRVRWGARREDGRSISVRSQLPSSLLVRGVANELREVITNLVVNAVDAMPDGGVLDVQGATEGRRAILKVRDSGCGIPEDVLGRVFDPFFTTKGKRGNGLGLSIARELIERHGGSLSITSEVGVGTTMCVALDLAPEGDDEPGCDASGRDGVGKGPEESAIRALVVDDEPSVGHLVARVLSAEGYAVDVVHDGAAGLAALNAGGDYGLIVTDVRMPGVSGLEIARAARESLIGVQVLLVTGEAPSVEFAGALSEVADAVLLKPFTIGEMRDVLGRMSHGS